MKSNIEEKLEDINPKKMTENEKSYIWSRIEEGIHSDETNTVSEKADSIRYFFMRIKFRKYALVPLLIIAFIAGTMTSTFAFANEANPGDFLFPVDVAAEKILLTLTFGDSNDELQLRFAEERLDEVKELLALASVVVDDDEQNATSTDDGTDDDTSTSTDDGTDNDTSTSTDDGTDNDSDGDDDTTNKIGRAQNAFIVAQNHLENARASLLDKGNDLAVAVIDDMILELSALVENHIASLESYRIKIDEDDDEIKIALQVSTEKVKTKFKFEIDPDKADGGTSLDISESGSGSKTKVKDGEFKISQEVKDNSSKKDKRPKKPEQPNKIEICHKGKNTIKISKFALWAHLVHGDSKGECDDDGDDDDQDDTTAPTITNISASVGINEATVSWTTNENATSTIWFATTTPISPEPPTESVSSDTLTLDHSLVLNNLLPETKYYLVVEVADAAGNHTQSIERVIITDPEPDEGDSTPPVITDVVSDPRKTSADISWETDENADSRVWYSTATPVDPISPTNFVSSGSMTTLHFLTINGLNASTTYFYIVESKDNDGNVATSTQESFITDQEPEPADETPPVISDISAISTTTQATISWSTDEDATSKVFYSNSSPIDTNTATSVDDSNLVTNHLLDIMGLTADTQYFYIVESQDAVGNNATSSEESFTTDPEPVPVDETPPVISGISVTEIASTTATVSWSTDENADGIIYYDTLTPLDTGTALSLEINVFSQDHSFELTSLSTSTIHYFIVESADEEGNTASSTEDSFITL